MPRKSRSKKTFEINADESKTKKIKVVNLQATNPFESHSSSSDSSDTDSSDTSSSDSELEHDRKIKKRKLKNYNKKIFKLVKKSKKKHQSKIDLFQRVVDVKLNYLENLLQTISETQKKMQVTLNKIQSQGGGPSRASSTPVVIKKQMNISLERALDSVTDTEMPEESTELTEQEKTQVIATYQLPVFPISDFEVFQQFDRDLKDLNFRKYAISALHNNVLGAKSTVFSRMKKLVYSLINFDLFRNFSWTGKAHKKGPYGIEVIHKNALSDYIGFVTMIKGCLDYGNSEKIGNNVLVQAFQEAIKRNHERYRKRRRELEFLRDEEEEDSKAFYTEELIIE